MLLDWPTQCLVCLSQFTNRKDQIKGKRVENKHITSYNQARIVLWLYTNQRGNLTKLVYCISKVMETYAQACIHSTLWLYCKNKASNSNLYACAKFTYQLKQVRYAEDLLGHQPHKIHQVWSISVPLQHAFVVKRPHACVEY